MRNNETLRNAMKRNGFAVWQVADLLGVHENTVFRRLRHEMPEEEQQRIAALIEDSKKEKGR